MIAQRLRDLDNRVLHLDEKQAALRTEEGWRKNVRRWKLLATIAAADAALVVIFGLFGDGSVAGLAIAGLGLAFQAGMLKAEDDRLHQRGMYKYKPPGL
jgi:hypothetical protein